MTHFAQWHAMEAQIAALLAADPPPRAPLFAALSNYSRSLVAYARRLPLAPIEPGQITRASAWLARPVFVCGHHRSGTTLLQELLDDHPQLLVLPTEITYFASFARVARVPPAVAALDDFVAEWITRLIDPNGKRHFHLGRADATRNPAFEFARRLFCWQESLTSGAAAPARLAPLLALVAAYRDIVAPDAEPRHWVEKSPLNERFHRRFAVLPQARFIQMIREPGATLRSQLADLRGAAVPGIDSAEQAWRIGRSLRIARAHLARRPANYRVMRYEDLVQDTVVQMRQVAGFLGIDFGSGLVVPTVLGAPVGSNSAFGRGAEGTIVAAARAGALDGADARLVEIFAGRDARAFGYGSGAPDGLPGARARCGQLARLASRLVFVRLRHAVNSFRRRQTGIRS